MESAAGRVVPAAMNIVVAPVEADEPFGRSGSDVWRQDLHGFDFRLPPTAQATRQSRPLLANLAPRSLVAPLQVSRGAARRELRGDLGGRLHVGGSPQDRVTQKED